MNAKELTALLKAIIGNPMFEKKESFKEALDFLQNEKVEPRPCPWCGEKVKFYQTPHGMWWLECENYACPVQPMSQVFSRKDKLVRKWNERAEKGAEK